MLRDIRFKARIFGLKRSQSGRLLTTVRTDANGRYISEGLAAGNYRVTLVVNGVVKTSINNTTLEPGESTQLNFDLTHRRASVTVRERLTFGFLHTGVYRKSSTRPLGGS